MHRNNIFRTDISSNYYHLWIMASDGQRFFPYSRDKAFFISLLQDQLSYQTKLHNISGVTNYADDIDLLAYSLASTGVHLLIHSEDEFLVGSFGQSLLMEYVDHLTIQQQVDELPFDSIFTYDKLGGINEAFELSCDIHLMHDDWRHDRYSSIGFYLDDRRGDWLRPWRLMALYNKVPAAYLENLQEELSLREPVHAPSFLET